MVYLGIPPAEMLKHRLICLARLLVASKIVPIQILSLCWYTQIKAGLPVLKEVFIGFLVEKEL